jgi:hypothetical protein
MSHGPEMIGPWNTASPRRKTNSPCKRLNVNATKVIRTKGFAKHGFFVQAPLIREGMGLIPMSYRIGLALLELAHSADCNKPPSNVQDGLWSGSMKVNTRSAKVPSENRIPLFTFFKTIPDLFVCVNINRQRLSLRSDQKFLLILIRFL